MERDWLFQTVSDRAQSPISEQLRREASEEGFKFIDRLVTEWRDGSNRFNKAGEILLGVFLSDGEMIAVGGLNRDFAFPSGVGRLRHVYIRAEFRRQGIASALLDRLERHARSRFDLIRLRTDTPEAARFYEGRGYQPIGSETATHVLQLADTATAMAR
jgi:GNAT superfamily N-acetyltransferase